LSENEIPIHYRCTRQLPATVTSKPINPRTTLNSRNLLLLAGTTLIALLLAEGGLRLAGYQPWIGMAYANRAKTTEFHPERGWDLKQGTFHRPPYSPQGSNIVYTQLPGGFRRSHSQQNGTLSDKPKLILFGGSYTHGNAISDNETFSWKLQQKLPGLEVLNYAVGGYGTLQAQMKLQQILPTIQQRKLIIYGLIAHHMVRNVSTTGWISSLSRYSRNDLYIPYVNVDENRHIRRQPLLHFSPFPFREYSALIALLENTWISTRWRKHNDEPVGPIMATLVSEMKILSDRHGADFLVVLLSVNKKAVPNYMERFSQNGIKALNCSFPLTRDMIVIGDGHPNGRMNTRWARCIGNYLDAHHELLPDQQAHTGTAVPADQ